MTGNARIEDEKDSVMGDMIKIWIHEEKMTVEPGRLVIYPDKKTGSALLDRPRERSSGGATRRR